MPVAAASDRPSRPWRLRGPLRHPVRHPALALLTLALLLVVSMPTSANHPQDGVTFDSLGGNEWWVDVQLGGSYDFYSPPEVRDTNGDWAYMDHPSWAAPGRYVTSYHVEPGHLVKFRVTYRDTAIVSCSFTHPAGVEQCDGGEEFTATFTPSGTAESIRVRVDSSQPLLSVNWRVMGTQGSWGGPEMQRTSGAAMGTTSTWASTVHVPEGEVLRFSARSADEYGHIIESAGCWRWPTATPVACPVSDYLSVQPPVSYDGSQSHMENQAYYSPDMEAGRTETLARLDVRFNGGTFNAMRLDRTAPDSASWSYHRYDSAPTTRSVAQYRGLLSDGRMVCEQIGYFWPPAGFPDRYNTGETVQFTNVNGNTGWVQTNLYSSKPVVAVEASVNGGPWRALQQQPWCDWAVAMDAPAGTVVFRGFFPDLTSWTSEPFQWRPGGTTGFGATFSQVGGNEWWEQVKVDPAGGTLSKVDVRVNGGAWKPLAKQSWGTNMWAGSYQAVSGSAVQFRATSTAAESVVSACYRWLPSSPAQTVTCPTGPTPTPTPTPTPGAFDATFTGVKGNEWWVQASVSGNQPIQNVAARINCSEEWRSLTKQSYGWAASFHVPAGSKVDFRATSNVGNMDFSSGYIWPQATPTAAC